MKIDIKPKAEIATVRTRSSAKPKYQTTAIAINAKRKIPALMRLFILLAT